MGKCEIFKSFRGSAPDPAGGLTAPPRPPAGEGPCCARLVLLRKTYHRSSFHILRTSAGPVSFSLLRPCDGLMEREIITIGKLELQKQEKKERKKEKDTHTSRKQRRERLMLKTAARQIEERDRRERRERERS